MDQMPEKQMLIGAETSATQLSYHDSRLWLGLVANLAARIDRTSQEQVVFSGQSFGADKMKG